MKIEYYRYWGSNPYTGGLFNTNCLQLCVKWVSSSVRECANDKIYTYGAIDDEMTGARYITDDGKNWIIQENEVKSNENDH